MINRIGNLVVLALVLFGFTACVATKGDFEKFRGDVNRQMAGQSNVAKALAERLDAQNARIAGHGQQISALETAGKALGQKLEKQSANLDEVGRMVNAHGAKLGEFGQKLEKQSANLDEVSKMVSTHGIRLGEVGQKVDTQGSELGKKADAAVVYEKRDVDKKLARVSKRVSGVAANASSAHELAGILKHATVKDAVLVWGFPVAGYSDDSGDFTRCAELLPGVEKRLDKVAARAKAEGRSVVFVGYASNEPFKRNGIVRADSDELNANCAERRAQKSAEYLNKVLETDVHTYQAGGTITADFGGDTAKNRGVLAIFQPKP